MKKKNAEWRRLLAYLYCLCALVVYYLGYHSNFSPIRDTYGLSNGRIDKVVFYDFFGMVDYCYIKLINGLFYYLGEKVSVITGFHIACGFLSFLFLFFAFKKFHRPYLTYTIPSLFVAVPFLICDMIDYDGFILLAFAICFLFYLVVLVILAITKIDMKPQSEETHFETLTERELKESQKPKTIVNDKGETIKLLANPLPGPKKHVKKTLDYDLDVSDDKMFYDVDREDFGDYELK